MKKSASLGNEDALINLGFMYISRHKVFQRYEKKAAMYIKKAKIMEMKKASFLR